MATDFGKRVAQARDHAGLTQEDLCKRIGMAQSTLAAAENTGHGSRMTVQLAVACGVNPIWLAMGDGEMLDPLIVRPVKPAAPSIAVTLEHALALLVKTLGELRGLNLDVARTALHKLIDHPEVLDDALNAVRYALAADGGSDHRKRA